MSYRVILKISCLFSLLIVGFSLQSFGQNLALSATPTQSGGGVNSTGYGPSNYNDGVIPNCGSTPWGWVSTNGWIQYEWSTPQNIQVVKFFKDNRPMTSCTIQYWNGSSFVNVQSYSNSVTCFDSVTFATAVTTTRLRFTSVSGSSNPNHREIEVYGPLCNSSVTQDPQPITVCEGNDAEFEIAASFSGGSGAYRWQVDEGSGFNDIANGTHYTNATTKKLTIKNAPYSMNGYEFRCIAEVASCVDTSMPTALTVNGLVKLEDLKSNDTTCINSVKELQVKGTGSITGYQWQMFDNTLNAFVNVPVGTPYDHLGNILRINGVPLGLNDTRFRVIVNGICDFAQSKELVLAVNDVPKVAVPPADINTKQGQTVIFEVKSTVTPAKYQWQVASPNDTFVNINEGGIYRGVRGPRLEVAGVSRVQNDFKFRCIVRTASSCAAPGDTSNFGLLFVEPALSVDNITGDNNFSLYPNPSADIIYIKPAKVMSGMQYVVLDRTGRKVLEGEMSNSEETKVDISLLPTSLYIVKIINRDNQVDATMKFTKM